MLTTCSRTALVAAIIGTAAAGCTDPAHQVCSRDQAVAAWQAAFSAGALVNSSYGPGYQGACPAFASRTVHVSGGHADCDPGCGCALSFDLSSSGDVSQTYSCEATFTETCHDGSSLHCYAVAGAAPGVQLDCVWLSGQVAPGVDPWGDCHYSLALDTAGAAQ